MSDKKDIRKQIRNVVLEEGGLVEAALKVAIDQTSKLQDDRLSLIEGKCLARLEEIAAGSNTQLEEINKRSRAIQGYLVGQVKGEIQAMIVQNEDKIDAMIAILAENGVTIPDLAQKVADKIPEIRQAKADAAAKAMTDRLEAERAASETASA